MKFREAIAGGCFESRLSGFHPQIAHSSDADGRLKAVKAAIWVLATKAPCPDTTTSLTFVRSTALAKSCHLFARVR